MGAARRAVLAVTTALLVTLGVFAGATTAGAAAGDVGMQGPSFSGATNAPTADKPQSKMWFTADGQWWANMFDTNSKTWHIFSLNRATKTWTDSGVQVDTRANTSSDALLVGTNLYIGTHVVRTGTSSSSTSSPMRLYRYTYDAANKKFVSSGSPATISNYSSESLTIDRDSGGTIWATWTVVSGTTSKVYVNDGTSNGATWGTPMVMPTTGGLNNPNVNPNVAVDDISALVAFGSNKIGVLWSNQNDGFVYWSVHNAGQPRTQWTGGFAVKGSKIPDDHLNLKSIQADAQGRVFAAVKTSLDHGTNRPTDPQINLLQYKPGTGAWSTTTFGTIADCHTRPQVVLDESNSKVYVFATGKTGTGTCTSNGDGAIYYKSTSLDAPSFGGGSGTVAIRDAAAETLNNVTTMKQSATSTSGIVVLASNNVTKRYWWNDIVAGSGTPTGTAPVSSFTASPTSGTAPLTVTFANKSTGSPTPTYSWDFGDGTTSTAVTPPAHTYTAAGTYSVKLTATNTAGTNTSGTTITVTGGTTPPPPSGTGIALVDKAEAGNSTAVTAVTIPKPAGAQAGDVLVAQITADAAPSVSAAPAGWTSVASQSTSGARLFVYSHVVGGSDPGSYTWTLGTAVKWNAGIAAYRGVNTTTPWDTAPTTAASAAAATTLVVPAVTTQTAGALLVGGLAVNSSSAGVTPPTGWTEALEATGIQVTEVAHKPQATAGSSGTGTWTLTGAYYAAGWMGALKPA
jgi:PKD repeat protein